MPRVLPDLVPALVPDLSSPDCYPHAVREVHVMDTHISRVYLTGDYAYKVKKPVNLGFLDFTTLKARERYCREELALNRRLAPDLYLDVVAVRGSREHARIDGDGPVIDYAVKMREFPQDALASRMLARGELAPPLLAGLAARIAHFHDTAPADAGRHGTPAAVQAHALQNFEQMASLVATARDRAALATLKTWTLAELARVRPALARRHAEGRVREVHGDLHLGNIVLLDGALVPFDCIEFNAALRWNDVLSEVAFLVMDLVDRGAAGYASLFLDVYLAHSGDYEGLGVLRFFLVYRALVRAKIHLLRARQVEANAGERRRLVSEFRKYVGIARAFARPGRAALLVMHGVTACGKSTAAATLLQCLGAVRLRSDVERKRLAGLPPDARTGSPIAGGLYAADRSEATYARLDALARTVLAARYPVIADATFLERRHRSRLAATAQAAGVRWALIDVTAPDAVLRRRVLERAAAGGDPSEATLAVLERQLAMREPLDAHERRHTIAVDGERGVMPDHCARIARKVGLRPLYSPAQNSEPVA
jgi:aminoglycoside phosphotransferase family enzyme/predicted kinase